MNQRRLRPYHPHSPIHDLTTLLRALGLDLSVAELAAIAKSATSLYRRWEEPKKNGRGMRPLVKALPPLDRIQLRIKTRLLDQVRYPHYLYGGIRDREAPRDPIRNATVHAGAWIQLTEDIEGYFRAISFGHIFDIWHMFFRFSGEVSTVLAGLTLMDGELPQGACTSQALANLVFWEREHSLYQWLECKGFRYSRFTDDVTASSVTPRSNPELATVKAFLIRFFESYGFRLSRKKATIQRRYNRMESTGYVNNTHVGVAREIRSSVRSAVRRLEILAAAGYQTNSFYRTAYRSVSGQVARIHRLHSFEGTNLRQRLDEIKPRISVVGRRKRGDPVWHPELVGVLNELRSTVSEIKSI